MSDSNVVEAADETARLGYAAIDAGDLRSAATHFERLTRLVPENADYHYMAGLAFKYLFEWKRSLDSNRRSLDLRSEPDAASLWNAGIAATALGDWAEARRCWQSCGMTLPGSEGPIEGNFGVVSIRLNAWGDGETVFARRIDPVRAMLVNVPFPASGYRFGDVVLHDGASTGRRDPGDGNLVPVFNAFSCFARSPFVTYTAFIRCKGPGDIALLEADAPGIALVEDWTGSVASICLRCSYGTPHEHEAQPAAQDWTVERHVGIAAGSRASVDALLGKWKSKWRGRHVDAVETREFPVVLPARDAGAWWRPPDE